MAMILEIMKNMDIIERCGYIQEVVSSLETFLLTREAKPKARRSAHLILQHAKERETKRNVRFRSRFIF